MGPARSKNWYLELMLSQKRLVMVVGSLAMVAIGAIAACSGFSSEDSRDTSDSGSLADSSGGAVDATDSSVVLADASDSGGPPLAQFFYCRDSQDAGHYACLDFEDGGGRDQWNEENQLKDGKGQLEIVDSAFASPTHSAVLHFNSFKLTPAPLNQRSWTIAAKVKRVVGSDNVPVFRIAFSNGFGFSFALSTDMQGSRWTGGSGGYSYVAVEPKVNEGFVPIALSVSAKNDVDGGLSLSAVATVGDASTEKLVSATSLTIAGLSFGSANHDGGVFFDDVMVDVVAEAPPATDAAGP